MQLCLFMILVIPYFILWGLWGRYFRKIVNEGLKYVGDDYIDEKYKISPLSSVKLNINGKCAIIINGGTGWATIRVNGGPREKVFKIRLLNTTGTVEIINDSRLFPIVVSIRHSP